MLIYLLFIIVLLIFLIIYLTIKFRISTISKSNERKTINPIPLFELKGNLLKLNSKNPFKIIRSKERDIDLEVSWKIADAKWIEMLGKGWHNLKYLGYLVFDEPTHTLRYTEKIIEKNVTSGPLGFSKSSKIQKGTLINSRIKSHFYGIKEDGSIGEVYKYDFTPTDIKGVIRQIANNNGWNFKVYFSKNRMKKN